jgi:2-(1,2-epoxy-1,2-dihydrophenyl)acetyl-CoA isomerase
MGGRGMSDNSPLPLLFERDGAVAKLTLNRPEAGNSINVPLARALMEASIVCDEDDTIRCVLLTGAGRLFCAGGDIGGFSAAGEQIPSLLKELTAYLHMAISRFMRMGKPLVTAVNGAAAGAGFSLALLGDITLAARSAKFTLAYGGIGLSPDGGSTWLLPRLVGMRRAQELALTNKRVSAEEAAALGLVTRTVDDDALAGEAASVAAQLAGSATRALGRTRNLLLSSFSASLEEQMELEARAIAASGRDSEGREGVAAYIAKRKPDFTI